MQYITGSSGFLGKHLIARLDKDVVCIPHDKISTIKLQLFDSFYFLSTYGNMSFHQEDDKILQANVIDLIHILEEVVKHDFKSFVFISTSSVRLRVQTMYSRTKKAAEEILLAFMEKHGIPICIIRPLSITGVGEQPEHLIPVLIDSCMTGKLINFVPNSVHDFIDVEDVVDGILSLSDHRARGIFELGTGKQYTNRQVLEVVEKVTGKKANINLVDHLRSYDNLDWVSLNLKARGYGWLPKKTLEISVKEMVEAYKQKSE